MKAWHVNIVGYMQQEKSENLNSVAPSKSQACQKCEAPGVGTFRFCGPCTRELVASGLCKSCGLGKQVRGTGNRCISCALPEDANLASLRWWQVNWLVEAKDWHRIAVAAMAGSTAALRFANGEAGDLAAEAAIAAMGTDTRHDLRVAEALCRAT